MEKIKLETAALLDSFKNHLQVKDKLLSLIQDSKDESINQVDDYYNDSVSKLDWSKSKNFNREWVKYILPHLQEHFNKCADVLGYQESIIHRIWYQQYLKNDTHGWHVHGDNYTGVYYVEYNDTSKTEIVNQFDQTTKYSINSKEGDIVIFPSFFIHRAPRLISDKRKTIISFNLEFNNIKQAVFDKIN